MPQKPVLPVKFSSQPVVLESDPKLGLLVCPLLTAAWGMVSKEKGVLGYVHKCWKITTHHPFLNFSMLDFFFLFFKAINLFYQQRDGQRSLWCYVRIQHIYTTILGDSLLRYQ